MSDKLDAKVAQQLLERLINDEGFRALFADNPAQALSEVGHDGDGSAAVCCKVDRLASPEALRRAREALQKQLTESLGQQPHLLAG